MNVDSITSDQWPEDWCISMDVTTPSNGWCSGSCNPDWALIGGSESACEGIYLYLRGAGGAATRNQVGFGVQCNAGGSDSGYAIADSFNDGDRKTYHFCYGSTDKMASIAVDGEIQDVRSLSFNQARSGKVTVFNGLHYSLSEQMTESMSASMHRLTVGPRPTIYEADGEGYCNSHYVSGGAVGVEKCAWLCQSEPDCQIFSYGDSLGCRYSKCGESAGAEACPSDLQCPIDTDGYTSTKYRLKARPWDWTSTYGAR